MRYVNEEKLLQDARAAGAPARALSIVAGLLVDAPEYPDLVSTAEAAVIMRSHKPHVARMRALGRLQPVPIAGKEVSDIYLRSDVERVAAELQLKRDAKRAAAEFT